MSGFSIDLDEPIRIDFDWNEIDLGLNEPVNINFDWNSMGFDKNIPVCIDFDWNEIIKVEIPIDFKWDLVF